MWSINNNHQSEDTKKKVAKQFRSIVSMHPYNLYIRQLNSKKMSLRVKQESIAAIACFDFYAKKIH